MPSKPGARVICVCAHCGGEFVRRPCEVRTYCSRACFSASKRIADGTRVGHLTVLMLLPDRLSNNTRVYCCRCDCGTEIDIPASQLRGKSARQRCEACHRASVAAQWRTHGKSDTRLYGRYKGIVRRCTLSTDKNYHLYGGRGITICERWTGPQGFANFLADMGEPPPGHSIERIDNDGPYSPENCRWATAVEQAANQRPRTLASHCGRGHELTPENVYIRPDTGGRQCRECVRLRARG